MRNNSLKQSDIKIDIFEQILSGVSNKKYKEINKTLGNCRLSGELVPGLIEDTACIVIEYGNAGYIVKISSEAANVYLASDDDFPIAIINYDSVASNSEFYSEIVRSIRRYIG